MKYSFVVGMAAFCLITVKSFSQRFDSVQVYAIYMKALYYTKLNKDLIKSEVDPVVVKKSMADSLYLIIVDSIKNGKGNRIKSNFYDVRLYLTFFKNGAIKQEIGFTAQNSVFINHRLYMYDKKRLVWLDKYLPNLSKTLGVR